MESLYVLQLEEGKYYVGKTSDFKKRLQQHESGDGSEWTYIYRPVKVLEQRRLKDNHDENNTTKDLMKKYGVDNVRGGAYCQVDLPETTKKVLRTELQSTANTCYTCGKPGHFANRCSATKEDSEEEESEDEEDTEDEDTDTSEEDSEEEESEDEDTDTSEEDSDTSEEDDSDD